MRVLSHIWLFLTPWTIARQAPLSMGFSRQEYWSELPSPSPEYLPNPGIKPVSLAFVSVFFTTSATWEAHNNIDTPGKKDSSWNIQIRNRDKNNWPSFLSIILERREDGVGLCVYYYVRTYWKVLQGFRFS